MSSWSSVLITGLDSSAETSCHFVVGKYKHYSFSLLSLQAVILRSRTKEMATQDWESEVEAKEDASTESRKDASRVAGASGRSMRK